MIKKIAIIVFLLCCQNFALAEQNVPPPRKVRVKPHTYICNKTNKENNFQCIDMNNGKVVICRTNSALKFVCE